MGLIMKNFNNLGVNWKIQFLEGGDNKKNNIEGKDCLKRGGAWTVCRFKGELGKKKGEWCFWGVVDSPMHTMHTITAMQHEGIKFSITNAKVTGTNIPTIPLALMNH